MSTHPVVDQLLTFFSNLFRNCFQTARHRLLVQLNPGTCGIEQADLNELHREALRLWSENPICPQVNSDIIEEFFEGHFRDIFKVYEAAGIPLSPELKSIILKVVIEFTKREPTLFAAPIEPPNLASSSFKDQSTAKRKLRRYIKHNRELDHYMELWVQDVVKIIYEFLRLLKLPRLDSSDASKILQLETQLFELAEDPGVLIDMCFGFATSESAQKDQFFDSISWKLTYNFNAFMGVDHHAKANITIERLMEKYPGLKTADKLLTGTPFHPLLLSPLPIPIPEKVRFEHMHILAGTGHGKTQALQHLIVSDLQRPPEEVPSMVILDSQGDMLNNLKRLALFDPQVKDSLADRLLIVDPSDVEFAPSLNLFDIQSDRLDHYNQKDREQVLAGIIEIYDYIFGGLLGAELTQKQNMVFRFLAQLMLSIPGSTIHTLRDLLIDASPYMQHVAKLPDTARGFFETQFFAHGYKATREQILRRLYGVLQNPSFERMFASPKNRLDLFDTLNGGGIVLVNTAKDFMKSEASSMFGRYIIALTFKAAMERAIMPEHERRPTFLWIDEASEYFDDNIDNLLIQSRKYKLGLVMAHQYLGQLPRGLPASLMTNTSIKLAGGLSDKDNRDMAREMRTSADFIAGMTKEQSHSNFAAYVRNVTPQAMKLNIPFGTAENLPRMSDESCEILLNESRKRLAPESVEESEEAPDADAQTEPESSSTSSSADVFWEKG